MFTLPLGLGLHVVPMFGIFYPVECWFQMWVAKAGSGRKRPDPSVELSPLPSNARVCIKVKSAGVGKGQSGPTPSYLGKVFL